LQVNRSVYGRLPSGFPTRPLEALEVKSHNNS
jgi:hypothetical protein